MGFLWAKEPQKRPLAGLIAGFRSFSPGSGEILKGYSSSLSLGQPYLRGFAFTRCRS